jgi:hypothetical protein
VVASNLGSRRETVRNGQTGLLYRSHDIQDPTSKVQRLISDRSLCTTMGLAAREVYLAEDTPATNYQMLIRIYEETVYRSGRNARQHAGTHSGAGCGIAGGLVAHLAQTMRDSAVAANQQLTDEGTRALGTILNQWDPRKTSEYV